MQKKILTLEPNINILAVIIIWGTWKGKLNLKVYLGCLFHQRRGIKVEMSYHEARSCAINICSYKPSFSSKNVLHLEWCFKVPHL